MDLTGLHAAWDARTEAELVAVGSVKWTAIPGTIGAFVAEMDFGVAPAIHDAVTRAMTTGFTGYAADGAQRRLANATADWHARAYGWAPSPADVHPVADVVAAAEFAVRHLSRAGSPVIVPTPAYMPFLQLPGMCGREVIEVPAITVDGRATLDLDGLAAAFAAGGDLLLLTNPWNPVGRVLEAEELAALAAVVETHGGHVFADEIHGPLVLQGRHVPYASVSATAAGHSATATSASKAWNIAGFKCAQLILTNDRDRAVFAAEGDWLGHGVATIGIVASTAAYERGGTWLDATRDYLRGNAAVLERVVAERLPGVHCTAPEGTYIAWLDMRETGLADPAEFFRRTARVAMTDGAACGAPGFVRFVFALPRPLLETALERIAAALRDR